MHHRTRTLLACPDVILLRRALAGLLGAVGAYALARRPSRDPERQAALEVAVAAIDRELAANLELAAIFGQTRQAFVLENGLFHSHAGTLEREAPTVHAAAAELYRRIPETEAAMERRGPANSLPEAERLLVEVWEGDARALQVRLREAVAAPAPSALERLIARLRARSVSR